MRSCYRVVRQHPVGFGVIARGPSGKDTLVKVCETAVAAEVLADRWNNESDPPKRPPTRSDIHDSANLQQYVLNLPALTRRPGKTSPLSHARFLPK
jgi:hypothetical protein